MTLRGGHGFESRWSPDIFLASSFQLLKLEKLLWWSLFTFIYNRSTIWISYIYFTKSLLPHTAGPLCMVKKLSKWHNSPEIGWPIFNQYWSTFLSMACQWFNLPCKYSGLTVLYLQGEQPGWGGGTTIWNRRGCSSEILNLTPKWDHLGVA